MIAALDAREGPLVEQKEFFIHKAMELLASFSGRVFERLGPGVGPREKLVDRAGEMTADDPRECVGEIGVRVDVV